MERSDSSRSFRENYQEYFLLQRKGAVLLDEYLDRKIQSDVNASEAKRALDHVKYLMKEMGTFIPMEGAVDAVQETVSSFSENAMDKNIYSSTIMDLRKLDGQHHFDSLPVQGDVPHPLLHAVQQHKRIMSAMPKKRRQLDTNGKDNQHGGGNSQSWSVIPSFCNSNIPVVDIRNLSQDLHGKTAAKHFTGGGRTVQQIEDSINWVSFLIQREQFHTQETRQEMAMLAKRQAKAPEGHKDGNNAGVAEDNIAEGDNLLSDHLDASRDKESPNVVETALTGPSTDENSQKMLREALGEIPQEELLSTLYRSHIEATIPNPMRNKDTVKESEHIDTLANVIVDHYARTVNHTIKANKEREHYTYETTVKVNAVIRIQCLFRRKQARKKLNAFRTQKRVMDALQVLMCELGRTDVKSLSLAQADIQAMEKLARKDPIVGSGSKATPTGSMSTPKQTPIGRSSSSSSSSGSRYSSPLVHRTVSAPVSSGGSSYRSDFPDSDSKVAVSSLGSDSKPHTSFSYQYKASPSVPIRGIASSPSPSTYVPSDEGTLTAKDRTGSGLSSISDSSNTSSIKKLNIVTANNTLANTSNVGMHTNFISPKHATNVMENVPSSVQAVDSVTKNKGILFASPLAEEKLISPDDSNAISDGSTISTLSPDKHPTVEEDTRSNLVSIQEDSPSGPTINIPLSRSPSELAELIGDSRAPTAMNTPHAPPEERKGGRFHRK